MPKNIVGMRVQLTIEEDGTDNPPSLPLGTVVRRLIGTDRNDYYAVRLDRSVTCIRATTGRPWTLHELVVVTSDVGTSLEVLKHRGKAAIWVGVMNLLVPIGQEDPMLDFSKGEYFAIGWIRRA